MLLDKRKLKFIALCAYLRKELEIAEEQEKEGNGQIVVTGDIKETKEVFLSIKSRIETYKYDYNNVRKMTIMYPQLITYYNTIAKTVERHIKEGEYWVSGLIVLSTLQEFTLKGYTMFNDIDFTNMIDRFIVNKDSNFKLYLRIAGEIFEDLEQVKYKRVKKKRKN